MNEDNHHPASPSPAEKKVQLDHDHSISAILHRLDNPQRHHLLGDFLLGAIDGCITTFSIIAGAAGAQLSPKVSLVLGVANVLADGLSMAAGNYMKTKTDEEVMQKYKKMEEEHILVTPEGEKEEIRQIFKRKGIEGKTLDDVVDIITQDKERWINTMLTEEFGLQLETPSPLIAALMTFSSFCIIGFIPLLPFILFSHQPSSPKTTFYISSSLTFMTFFVIGLLKGKYLKRSLIKSGLETLLIGGSAAIIAYSIGHYLGT